VECYWIVVYDKDIFHKKMAIGQLSRIHSSY